MAEQPEYCPECGNKLEGKSVCENCGYKVNAPETTPDVNVEPVEKTSPENLSKEQKYANTWRSLEPIVEFLGTYAFFITLAFSAIQLLFALLRLVYWWGLISSAGALALSIMFIKPFGEKVKQKDYYYIVNDVFVVSSYRIPKILVISIATTILLDGWGGLLLLFPVFCIIFIGPVPTQWEVGKTPETTNRLGTQDPSPHSDLEQPPETTNYQYGQTSGPVGQDSEPEESQEE